MMDNTQINPIRIPTTTIFVVAVVVVAVLGSVRVMDECGGTVFVLVGSNFIIVGREWVGKE
jgi:hypothetical protein